MWEDGKRQLIHGLPYIDRERAWKLKACNSTAHGSNRGEKNPHKLLTVKYVPMEQSDAAIRCSWKKHECA